MFISFVPIQKQNTSCVPMVLRKDQVFCEDSHVSYPEANHSKKVTRGQCFKSCIHTYLHHNVGSGKPSLRYGGLM